jgi:putative transposase
VWSSRRGSRSIEHLGSVHDEAALAALKAAAAQRLAAGRAELDLGVAGRPASRVRHLRGRSRSGIDPPMPADSEMCRAPSLRPNNSPLTQWSWSDGPSLQQDEVSPSSWSSCCGTLLPGVRARRIGNDMALRRRHTPDQIIRKLAEGNKLLGSGQGLDEVCRHLEVAESTWHRWLAQYGGMNESRLELANLLLADFDPAVQQISAQPFVLRAEVDGQSRRHIPGYLLGTRGSPVVVDVVRSDRMIEPKVVSLCAWTRRVVESLGW